MYIRGWNSIIIGYNAHQICVMRKKIILSQKNKSYYHKKKFYIKFTRF